MSYILDALRKAERERRLGSSPDVMTVQDVRPLKGRSVRSLWMYLLLAALFLNAGMFAWWLGPWNGKRPAMPTKVAAEKVAAVAVKPDVSAPAASPASLPSGKADVAGKSAADTGRGGTISSERVKKAAETSVMPQADTAVEGSIAEKPAAVSQVKEESDAADEPPPPAAGNIVYAFNQLPSSVRQGLPDLTMSLHYFTDDPSSRVISIDGKTLREGEDVVPGLKLEKITAAGAVFDYKNYRFSIGIQPR